MTTMAGGLEREDRLTEVLSDLRSKRLQPTVPDDSGLFVFAVTWHRVRMAAGVLSGPENCPPFAGRVGSSPTLTVSRERGDDGESHRSVKSGRFGALGVRIPPLPLWWTSLTQ
jgi:hypothetical protein